MKIDERLVRLERKLGKNIDRLARRKGTRPEAFELIPSILDDVEEHVEPTGGGGRTFPYDRLVVQLAVDEGRTAATRAVLAHDPPLAERIQKRIAEAGCDVPQSLDVSIKIQEGPQPQEWGGRDFRIDYQQKKGAGRRTTAPHAAAPTPAVRLVVLRGRAGRRTHELQLARIDLGRMETVVDKTHRSVRRNQLAFLDEEDEVNATVSRAHAHVEYVAGDGFRLFDDDSAQGTRIVRDGKTHDVPRRGSRGVKLKNGDEIELGQARVRFETE